MKKYYIVLMLALALTGCSQDTENVVDNTVTTGVEETVEDTEDEVEVTEEEKEVLLNEEAHNQLMSELTTEEDKIKYTLFKGQIKIDTKECVLLDYYGELLDCEVDILIVDNKVDVEVSTFSSRKDVDVEQFTRLIEENRTGLDGTYAMSVKVNDMFIGYYN